MTTYTLPTPITWDSKRIKPKKKYKQNLTIGVLSLQGDFLEHILILKKLHVNTKEVRIASDLEAVDGLIIPGGESTTMARLLDAFKLRVPLKRKISKGLPVWGTCAGMILLAKKLIQDRPTPLGLMNIEVNRNAFGRQIDSFEVQIKIKSLKGNLLNATFIRAPMVTKIGKDVEILATLENDTIIAIKQDNMLATAFHPELTGDTRFHEYFINLVKNKK